MEAVKQGSAAIGLRSKTHVVLACVNKAQSELSSHQRKIFKVDDHIGVAIAGLTADGRVLSRYMRSECINHSFTYESALPVGRLVVQLADKAQVCFLPFDFVLVVLVLGSSDFLLKLDFCLVVIGSSFGELWRDLETRDTPRSRRAKSLQILQTYCLTRVAGHYKINNSVEVCTQRSWKRPYGVGLLVGGLDESGAHLYYNCPSGNYFEYQAFAIGSRSQAAKTYMERKFETFDSASREELIKHALFAIKETLQGEKLKSSICTVAVLGVGEPFHVLDQQTVQELIKSFEVVEEEAPAPQEPSAAPEEAAAPAAEAAAAPMEE
ncbi:hypothetical protein Cgig2_021198 [Carnegiea gigantea]|uniref:Proteasome endopeptidase complex n=1 Tax=Carnegiea gigantea TaxID=171969 RepID=A0A9Q1KXQ3_9CARY|nr:hypothetical protein Cgig2_021198 [Carnegiea gigantea]